jgi:6-phosphofructokinase 1
LKIGLVIFGIYPSGLKQLIYHVLSKPTSSHEYIGIEIDRDQGSVHYKPLYNESANSSSTLFIKASPESYFSSMYGAIKHFDAVIVFGTAKIRMFVDHLIEETENKRILFVPVSILNDIPDCEISLGYDTALNSIVENALKIQDTIHSLKYDKPRLFGVQVPRNAPDPMLEELARATEGYYVSGSFSDEQMINLCETIQSNFSNERTSSLLFYNEGISTQMMKERVLSRLNVDWKSMKIDEALCMGSHPTAIDRILASRLAEQIRNWTESCEHSGQLIVKWSKVEFKEMIHC